MSPPEKFHERFDIPVDGEAARRRFTNRVDNLVFEHQLHSNVPSNEWLTVISYIASRLGDRFAGNYLEVLAASADFLRHLQAIEAFHDWFAVKRGDLALTDRFDHAVREVLDMSETDLGVRWEDGRFFRSGAPLLDEKLVNDPLRWLRAKGYETASAPFEKALGHLLRAEKDSSLLSDVVTDAYEALEAIAKIVTGRDVDLSANREAFVKAVKASDDYKVLLQVYISYANAFRHAAQLQRAKPAISFPEAESFVYMTGVFIRLADS